MVGRLCVVDHSRQAHETRLPASWCKMSGMGKAPSLSPLLARHLGWYPSPAVALLIPQMPRTHMSQSLLPAALLSIRLPHQAVWVFQRRRPYYPTPTWPWTGKLFSLDFFVLMHSHEIIEKVWVDLNVCQDFWIGRCLKNFEMNALGCVLFTRNSCELPKMGCVGKQMISKNHWHAWYTCRV